MTPDQINDIRINFDDNMVVIMNICLAFVMFGVALNLKLDDFKHLFSKPRKILIGLSSQLILLPILTLVLIYFWNAQYSIALGMVLVASCPGGNISNYATHLSRGNTALSITLTTIVTLSAAVITPFTFYFWAQWIPQSASHPLQIEIDLLGMFFIVLQLIFIPLILGMSITYYFPSKVRKIRKPISILSLIIFIGFIVGALLGNWSLVFEYVQLVFFLVIVHNGIALLAGYYYSKSWNITKPDAKAISLETGIQNAGLGLVLVFNFFPELGGMLLVVAWWGIWDLVSALALALYWRGKPQVLAQSNLSSQ
jgi:BASS family bile acid:Na+ symporter